MLRSRGGLSRPYPACTGSGRAGGERQPKDTLDPPHCACVHIYIFTYTVKTDTPTTAGETETETPPESRTMAASSAPAAPSQFDQVPLAPPDPIFGLTLAFRADPDPAKVNLGVGAYRTEEGLPWVLDSVRQVGHPPCPPLAARVLATHCHAGPLVGRGQGAHTAPLYVGGRPHTTTLMQLVCVDLCVCVCSYVCVCVGVAQAEELLLQEKANHEYLPIDGLAEFRDLTAKLILGEDSKAIQEKRVGAGWRRWGTDPTPRTSVTPPLCFFLWSVCVLVGGLEFVDTNNKGVVVVFCAGGFLSVSVGDRSIAPGSRHFGALLPRRGSVCV